MKKLISVLSLITALTACGSKSGSTVVAGDCAQTAYTNGLRVTCSNFDAVSYAGATVGVQLYQPCGSDLSIQFLLQDNGDYLDVRSGSIVPKAHGTYIEGSCQFTL